MTSLLALVVIQSTVMAPPQQANATAPKPFTLTKEIKKQTIDTLITEMNARYVSEADAKKMDAALKKKFADGGFDEVTDGAVFARTLSEFLATQVTDAHLRIRFSANPLPPRENPREPSADEIKRYEAETRFVNAAFEKVERLRGNVGYISFNQFYEPADMKRPLAAAMQFIANTDALIIDLRQNGGGDPAGVQLVCSYLFNEKPVHLNSLYFRQGNRTEEFWTLKQVDGPRYLDRDVFVLTSKRTGSGAEECSYNLKNLKRATIVGEPTWGGANPGGMVRLNDHFSAFIPVGKAINPITKTNWEGVGVAPDIAVDPTKSLKFTQALAIKKMIEREKDAERKADLEEILKQVEAGPDR